MSEATQLIALGYRVAFTVIGCVSMLLGRLLVALGRGLGRALGFGIQRAKVARGNRPATSQGFSQASPAKPVTTCPRCEGAVQSLAAVIAQGTQWFTDPNHGRMSSRSDLVEQLAHPAIPPATSWSSTACAWGLILAGATVGWLWGSHEAPCRAGACAIPVIDLVGWRILAADLLVMAVGLGMLWSHRRTKSAQARWSAVKAIYDSLAHCLGCHLVAAPSLGLLPGPTDHPSRAWALAMRLEAALRDQQRQADADERAAIKAHKATPAGSREEGRHAVHTTR